jgi:hypothetical protein
VVCALALAAVPGCSLADLLANRVFMASFTAWFIAQFAKVSSNRGLWRRGAGSGEPARRRARRRAHWRASGGSAPPRCRAAQIFTRRFKTGKWDVRAIVDSGGMPSSHSALCSVSGPPLQLLAALAAADR